MDLVFCFEKDPSSISSTLSAIEHALFMATTEKEALLLKALYITLHFSVITRRESNALFEAKGMVVAPSRLHIIWYKRKIEELQILLSFFLLTKLKLS
jgi:hypothetical protein